MRSVTQFTDGRIHVTLFEGAFDLAAMDAVDMGIYEQMLAIFKAGTLKGLESLADRTVSPFGVALRLQHRKPLVTIFSDMCRRMALEELGLSDMIEEFAPWRPEESRRLFEEATLYRPSLLRAALMAA